jgi:hypothetical protein
MYLGPLTDPEKSKKNKDQNRRNFTVNSNSFTSLNTSVSDFIFNTTVYETGSTTCAVSSCHPAVGMCQYGFDVTGSYGFKDIPLDKAIEFLVKGVIPGNAYAYGGLSVDGSNPKNGTVINSFVSGDGSIYDPVLYAEILGGGYTFRGGSEDNDLSFSTCEAYHNYTSEQVKKFQEFGEVQPAVINNGTGDELDSSHCGTISSIVGEHLTQASCVNGNYTLNSIAYSGSNLIWSTLG